MWLGAVSLSCALWSSTVAAQPSAADLETSRTLYKEGKDLRDAGKIPEARDKFRAAYGAAQTPITGLELARTHATLGEFVEARELCLAVARMPVTASETERSAAARNEAAELAEKLKPRIPSLMIRLPKSDGPRPTVAIDGQSIQAAVVGQPRKVNPGIHEVVVTFSDGRQSRSKVDVKESETKEVAIALPPPGAPVVVPPAPTQPPVAGTVASDKPASGLPGYAWAGFAFAGAGTVLGTITGIMANSKAGDLESACVGHQCPPSQYDNLDTGKRLGTLSNVAFGVALVGLVVGGVGWLSSRNEPSTSQAKLSPWVGPGSVGLGGAF
jgi:hypothetical protein